MNSGHSFVRRRDDDGQILTKMWKFTNCFSGWRARCESDNQKKGPCVLTVSVVWTMDTERKKVKHVFARSECALECEDYRGLGTERSTRLVSDYTWIIIIILSNRQRHAIPKSKRKTPDGGVLCCAFFGVERRREGGTTEWNMIYAMPANEL